MRPLTQESEAELYECFECGGRTERAKTMVCPSCGGELRNLSHSRDL